MQLMTTKQLADRLGLRRHQLVYLIDGGQIADSRLRVSNRRAFTEEEYADAAQIVRKLRPSQAEPREEANQIATNV